MSELRLHPGSLDRPDFVRVPEAPEPDWRIYRNRTVLEVLADTTWVRRFSILLVLAAIWQIYAGWLDNTLMLPSFAEAIGAFYESTINGPLLGRAATSIRLLLTGYALAVAMAILLTLLAVSTRVGSDLLSLLTSMFNPLPAIALLPLALLWFGLGEKSLLFVLVHAVLWPVALNTLTGFLGVAETLRMVGRQFGLGGFGYAAKLLVPAAFPAILTGLKIGWAFAWRTLIAAELVFGVSSGNGGLGWFIFENRNQLETANVFAGLLAVILIGLVVETLIFQTVEQLTVRRWGMQR